MKETRENKANNGEQEKQRGARGIKGTKGEQGRTRGDKKGTRRALILRSFCVKAVYFRRFL